MKSSNDKISGAGAGAGAGASAKGRKASKAAAGVQPATVQPATVNPFAMVVWAGSCIWGRSSVERAQALRRFRVGRVLWRQAQAAAKAQAAAGAAVLAAWQASRVAYWASVATVQPASVQPATASAGGGLVSMAAGLAAFNPARRASAVECQSVGDLLRGCERPAGPILRAIQLAGDLALVRSLAHKLNRKMVGDGRESCFKRDDSSGADFGAFDWVMSMREACNDATAKLIMYRAGYGLTRDESSGGDVLTVGDDLGNACGVWIKGFGKGFKGAFIPRGNGLCGLKRGRRWRVTSLCHPRRALSGVLCLIQSKMITWAKVKRHKRRRRISTRGRPCLAIGGNWFRLSPLNKGTQGGLRFWIKSLSKWRQGGAKSKRLRQRQSKQLF